MSVTDKLSSGSSSGKALSVRENTAIHSPLADQQTRHPPSELHSIAKLTREMNKYDALLSKMISGHMIAFCYRLECGRCLFSWFDIYDQPAVLLSSLLSSKSVNL
jgi:hypothetical protein